MDWLVLLRYPDGSARETRISTPGTLRHGSEFTAFGRRWRVVESEAVTRDGEQVELNICESVGFDGQTLVGRLSERAEWSQTA